MMRMSTDQVAAEEWNAHVVAQQRPPDGTGCPSCDSGDGWNYWRYDDLRAMWSEEPNAEYDWYYRDEATELADARYVYSKCGYCNGANTSKRQQVPSHLLWDWCHQEVENELEPTDPV